MAGLTRTSPTQHSLAVGFRRFENVGLQPMARKVPYRNGRDKVDPERLEQSIYGAKYIERAFVDRHTP